MAKDVTLILKLKDLASRALKKFAANLKKAEKQTDKNTKSVNKLKKGLNLFKLALTGAVAIAIRNAVRSFSKFESKMVDVGNLFGASRQEVLRFGKGVRDIAAVVPQDAQDLANSLFDVVSAGVEVGESLEFLQVAAKLAVAGVTDTKTAVDGLTSVMNAYSLSADEAEEISDKFFAAQVKGKTTIAELSGSIGQVASTSATAGLSIDELLGSVAALTTRGIKTRVAIIQMRQALLAVINPTKDASETAAALGLEFDLAALKSKGLSGFLKDVQEKTGGNVKTLAKLFGNVRALTPVLALMNDNFKKLDETLEAVEESAGATARAFEEQVNTLGGQLELLKTGFKNASKSIIESNSGWLTQMLKVINRFTTERERNRLDFTKFVKELNLQELKQEQQTQEGLFKAFNDRTDNVLLHEKQFNLDQAKLAKDRLAILLDVIEKAEKAEKEKNDKIEEDAKKSASILAKLQETLNKDISVFSERQLNDELRFNRTKLNDIKQKAREADDVDKAQFETAQVLLELRIEEITKALNKARSLNKGIQKELLQDFRNFGGDAETLVQSIGTTIIKGEGGLIDTLQTTVGDSLGTIGQFIGGGIGGLIFGLFDNIFGGGSKQTFQKTWEQHLKELRAKTETILGGIGEEKSVAEKQLEILEFLADNFGKGAVIPEKFLDTLGLGEGATVERGIQATRERLLGFGARETQALEDRLPELMKQINAPIIRLFGKENAKNSDMLVRNLGDLTDETFNNLDEALKSTFISGKEAKESRAARIEALRILQLLSTQSEFTLEQNIEALRLRQRFAELLGEDLNLQQLKKGGVIKKMASGGVISGGTSGGDRTLIAANAGEMVLNPGQQTNLLRMLNQGGAGGGSTINISGVFMGDQRQARRLAKMIDTELVAIGRQKQRISF